MKSKGLKYLAKIQVKAFSRASSFVQHRFYVDNGLTSVEAEETNILFETHPLFLYSVP